MIKISFGQALLLLIEQYQDKSLSNTIKEIYLTGVTSKEEFIKLITLFKECKLDEHYEISIDPNTINEDSTRRYFETHLAFETLQTTLNLLNLADITYYCDALYALLPTTEQVKFDDYLTARVPAKGNPIAEEYMDAFSKLESTKSYSYFSDDQKLKLALIFKCAWLSFFLVKLPDMPLNVYEVGFFAEQKRGRVIKYLKASAKTHGPQFALGSYSNHFGLMKSYMPVPSNDVIFTKKGFSFIRPPDRVNFDLKAAWPKKNFSTLVHPFSCYISGTMLSQIRCLKKAQEKNQLPFNTLEKFTTFLKCFTSSLLFNSGGHSYNEFLAVLKIRKVIKGFDFINNFHKINAASLLLNGNEEAFNRALADTAIYAKTIVKKQQVHADLLNNRQSLRL
ncbi:hypothetical protein ACNVED_01075 [Legionella sp. D16C41]|uniref:hypothetical protein n=1 Tax=Legionella sp. D16C41 TaxID=3402688 RepID=UPI003AF92D81